jgi:hypothetical protein
MLVEPEARAVEAKEPWRVALLKAADLIEEWGHSTFYLRDDAGRMCLHGAINAAVTGNPFRPNDGRGHHCPVAAAAHEAIGNFLGSPRLNDYRGADWNNAPGRTKDEVVAALRAAAQMPA